MTNRLELSVLERTPFAGGERFASTGATVRVGTPMADHNLLAGAGDSR